MSIPSAIDALRLVLGDNLSQSKHERDAHGQSESHFAPLPPDAVAYPQNTAEVSQIVKICNQHNCPGGHLH